MRTDLAAVRAPSNVGAIDVAAETSGAEWDAFVHGIRATGYHEWAWRAVFERAFGHETIYLSARSDVIVGVLPLVHIASRIFGRCLVSLPFVNYGGVAARHEAAARALVDRAAEIARQRGCRHVELRHTVRQFDDLACKQHKVAMYLPLGGDVDAAWEQLD